VTQGASSRARRADIQGLRAIAVGLVVLFHLWPHRLTGGFIGVDVFFVISGYLITAHLLDRPPTTGRDVAAFWARRIRRLLPAALLVIGVTLVLSRLVTPATQWASTAREAVASAFYVENWSLVASATDYLARGAAPSPLQHFWSLSVEEQFYAGWPLIIAGAYALGRRGGKPQRAVVGAIILVVVVSYVWSVYATASDPAAAYFVTPARLWELAAGGLLASTVGEFRLSVAGAATVAWLGLVAIGASAVALTSATAFPGWIAVVPILGSVAFLGAAANGPGSPTGILGLRPIQWMGDASYSIYLWHWPLLVLAPYVLEHSPRARDKLVILALTLILAGLTRAYVEERWRRPRAGAPLRRPFQFALAGMLTIGALGAAQAAEINHREQQAMDRSAAVIAKLGDCLGAGALARGDAVCPRVSGDVVPDPTSALKDRPNTFANRCFGTPPYPNTPSCTFGDGPIRLALVGNSHAAQWQPAFEALKDATLTTYLASECTTVDALLTYSTEKKAKGCLDWTARVQKRTSGKAFDLVVTTQRNVRSIVGHEGADRLGTLEAGYRRYLERWAKSGTKVLVLRDTPFAGNSVGLIPTCVAEHLRDQNVCSGALSRWVVPDPLAAAAQGLPGVTVVDLNRYICEPDRCFGVNGGVITYFDNSHLSETYARTLGPYLANAVRAALSH